MDLDLGHIKIHPGEADLHVGDFKIHLDLARGVSRSTPMGVPRVGVREIFQCYCSSRLGYPEHVNPSEVATFVTLSSATTLSVQGIPNI